MHNKGLEGKEKREGKEEKNEGIGEGRKEVGRVEIGTVLRKT